MRRRSRGRTDFIGLDVIGLTFAAVIATGIAVTPAQAQEVKVVGLFTGKALVSIDGAPPRTLAVGQETPEGVKLIAVDDETATFETNGQRRTLHITQGFAVAGIQSNSNQARLTADASGHYWADGTVNGVPVRFIVDTGATVVSLPSAMARRLGIDLTKARRGMTSTANGIATVYTVTLDSVSVGGITLRNVDAAISDGGLPVALLGMSFLTRTEMRQEGQTLMLMRRY